MGLDWISDLGMLVTTGCNLLRMRNVECRKHEAGFIKGSKKRSRSRKKRDIAIKQDASIEQRGKKQSKLYLNLLEERKSQAFFNKLLTFHFWHHHSLEDAMALKRCAIG
jgi:hypothetical protein